MLPQYFRGGSIPDEATCELFCCQVRGRTEIPRDIIDKVIVAVCQRLQPESDHNGTKVSWEDLCWLLSCAAAYYPDEWGEASVAADSCLPGDRKAFIAAAWEHTRPKPNHEGWYVPPWQLTDPDLTSDLPASVVPC